MNRLILWLLAAGLVLLGSLNLSPQGEKGPHNVTGPEASSGGDSPADSEMGGGLSVGADGPGLSAQNPAWPSIDAASSIAHSAGKPLAKVGGSLPQAIIPGPAETKPGERTARMAKGITHRAKAVPPVRLRSRQAFPVVAGSSPASGRPQAKTIKEAKNALRLQTNSLPKRHGPSAVQGAGGSKVSRKGAATSNRPQPQQSLRHNSQGAGIGTGLVEGTLTGVGSTYGGSYRGLTAVPRHWRGRRVRVTNLDTGVSRVWKVNDFGPSPKVHPDRVVDLSIERFRQLGGNLRAGLLPRVKVELLPKGAE